MRRFTADYLARTRDGLWEDRAALDPLALPSRSRVLDVGCGTGELTRVLAEETPGAVVGADADVDLLAVAERVLDCPVVAGDAGRLPFRDDAVDLVVCQALLVNLPDPGRAVAEFGRISTDLVAAVEPDNAAVDVASTVDGEADVDRRARRAFREGVGTDVAPGDRVRSLFEDAGLVALRRRRHRHETSVEPPYDEADLADAARKASGAGLADHEAELRRALGAAGYDDLREAWRATGRDVVAAMREGTYRRTEVVPFDVTVGRLPD